MKMFGKVFRKRNDKNGSYGYSHSNPLVSAISISFCLLFSRFTGLARDIFLAKYLGTVVVAEAFYVAFRLPNTFRRIFAEGAFSNAFVPFFSTKAKQDITIAKNFSFKVLVFLSSFLVILTLILEIFMPNVIAFINPGFLEDNDKFLLAVQLSRIAFPYVVLISLASFFGSILNSIGSFWQYSIVAVLLNLVFIFGLIFTKSFFSNVGFCLSYLLIFAGIIQVLFVLYFCIKKSVLPSCKSVKISAENKAENKKDFKLFLKKLCPAVFSSGILQINIFVDGIFASFFVGAVSYLYYADRIIQFPISIIGYSLSVAILPSFSVAFRNKNIDDVRSLQKKALNVASFFSIPAMCLVFSLGEPVVRTIFERGAFTSNDTEIVARMLIIFACSIPFSIISKILFSCFYSQKDTFSPMKISIFSLVFNIFSNLVLFKLIGMYCVAVSTACASVLSCVYAFVLLKKKRSFFVEKRDLFFSGKVILVSAISCVFFPLLLCQFNLFIILFICGLLHLFLCFRVKILTKDLACSVLKV